MENFETATLAGGCFWCSEALFKRLKGVISVASGYSGGRKENPSYDEVCTGQTGHAEAIQIVFDPKIISYQQLLEVFWRVHDPTTLNRQGNDVGEQYRSAIFYHNEKQKKMAEQLKEKLEEEKIYKDRIMTEIVPFASFYKAENHHQNYYDKNQDYPYCQAVIYPKLQKLLKDFYSLTGDFAVEGANSKKN